MHEAPGANHTAAKHPDQRLMAEADPEDRNALRKRLDHAHRDARVVRRPGPRRDREMCRYEGARRFDADRIVAKHAHVCAQDEERLHQVVSEGVIVIDQQQARAHRPSFASSSARLSAAPFARTSAYSAGGELSATMPAPAW